MNQYIIWWECQCIDYISFWTWKTFCWALLRDYCIGSNFWKFYLIITNFTPCPHYFGLYIFGSLLSHVKNVHPPTSLLSHANHVVLSLQVFSLFMFLLGFIFFAYWGWLWTQFSSILGLFRSHFAWFRWCHRILQASKMRLNMFFTYPLTKLLEIQWIS